MITNKFFKEIGISKIYTIRKSIKIGQNRRFGAKTPSYPIFSKVIRNPFLDYFPLSYDPVMFIPPNLRRLISTPNNPDGGFKVSFYLR